MFFLEGASIGEESGSGAGRCRVGGLARRLGPEGERSFEVRVALLLLNFGGSSAGLSLQSNVTVFFAGLVTDLAGVEGAEGTFRIEMAKQ